MRIWCPIEVIGPQGTTAIDGLIDTGFEGALCLPIEDAIRLGLQISDRVTVNYADGRRVKELVFAGQVRLFDDLHDVAIYLTESDIALIGTSLLENYRLLIDFGSGQVEIAKSPTEADAPPNPTA
jgi:clan AA aspartic protease